VASYTVLARKWRPAQFADLVGQTPVVRTLMNAIRAERIHQAYLLTGSRGIGKTSIARIFSKAIRCENVKWELDWLQSCDACASCREIASSNSVDVFEIDGASNNGVDAIREIRESARFLPASGKWKIYIIDEVHMLTTAAFNALLKTLEEPPPHIIFIFATTEPHKIPATILSRCQRFDLRRVTLVQIQERLAEVARVEGIAAESGALTLLARAAEGSMRDALSLLDQVIAFSGHTITAQSVRESIGLIEGVTLLGILKGVVERKPLEAISFVNQAYQAGHDLRVLTRSLIDFLHALILAKLGEEAIAALELSNEEWQELKRLAPLRPLEELELIFQVLHHGVDWIARSPQPKVVLDVLLIKCATAEALVDPESLSDTTPPKPSPLFSEPSPAVASTCASSWEGFVAHVKQSRPLLASILDHAVCVQFPETSGTHPSTDDILSIAFKPSNDYFHKQLQSRAYTEQLLALTQQFFSRAVRIDLQLIERGATQEESVATRREREKKEREKIARHAVENHVIIREAKALFGGELGPIELGESL
jgi:DNA polymerase III subunit gamma/tau